MASFILDPRSKAALLRRVKDYASPSARTGYGQLAVTVGGLLLAWTLAWASSGVSLLLTAALQGVAALFWVRLFILQHDLGHRSLLPSSRANDVLGSLVGVVTLMPHPVWRRHHNNHHRNWAKIDHPGPGYITTTTVREYQQRSAFGRWLYRLYRHPLVVNLLGGLYYFALNYRVPTDVPPQWKAERASIHLTNLGIVLSWGAGMLVVGPWTFLALHLPIVLVGSIVVMWFFLVQHNFEHTYWRHDDEWDFVDAALLGSSYYRLPRFLQWMTASVGLHHVHHIAPLVPSYRLQACLDDIETLRIEPISSEALRRVPFLSLWDEDRGRLVGFDAVGHGRRRVTRTAWERARTALGIVGLHAVPIYAIASPQHTITTQDWIACGLLYVVGVFASGVCLHRYFTHHAFKASRPVRVALAWIACTSLTDPISFCGKHRLHHRHSDTELDVHSPRAGLWYCWIGSLIDEGRSDAEVMAMAPELASDPMMVWLHRHFWVPGLLLALAVHAVGGLTMVAIGFCLSRALVLHGSSAVNFFCHRVGARPFSTRDDSRNNVVVALLTLGEGWHNNHHYAPGSARSGAAWWQLDPCYWMILALAALGLVHDVHVTELERRRRHGTALG